MQTNRKSNIDMQKIKYVNANKQKIKYKYAKIKIMLIQKQE